MKTLSDKLPSLSKAKLALLLIFLIGAVARLYDLGSPLWYDEIATWVRSLGGSLPEIVSSYTSNNDHPFYTLLAKISTMIFGLSEWSFRLPAALFGIAAIPLTYIFARRIVTQNEAIVTTAIFAFSYHLIWFSQNARGYTMLLVFTTICTYALHRAVLESKQRKAFYIIYAVSLALAAYTHLTMVLFGVAQAICVLGYFALTVPSKSLVKVLRPSIMAFIGAGILTILFYAPMFADVVSFFAADAAAPVKSNSSSVANPLWAIFAAISELSAAFGGLVPLLVAVFMLAVGGLHFLVRKPFITFLIALPIPIIILATVLLGRPIFPRFFFFISGFLIIAAIHGLWLTVQFIMERTAWPKRSNLIFVTIGAVIAIFMAVSIPGTYKIPKQNYQAAALVIDELGAEQSTYVIGITAELPFNQYLGYDFSSLKTVEDFDHTAHSNDVFYVVLSFETYIEKGLPDLWQRTQASCSAYRDFPSTIGGGEIKILKCGAE